MRIMFPLLIVVIAAHVGPLQAMVPGGWPPRRIRRNQA